MAEEKQSDYEVIYKSKLLNKQFNSLDELKSAEDEYKSKHLEELKLQKQRKEDSKKVDESYKKYLDTLAKAEELKQEYFKERNKFIDKYGYYHQTFTKGDDMHSVSYLDFLTDLFKSF